MKNKQASLMGFFRIKEFGAIVGVAVFLVLFSALSNRFLTVENFFNTLTMAAELGIISIGVAMLMISGEFDLSVGSVFAVAPMVFATMVNSRYDPYLSLVVSLAVCLGVGAVNGLVTLKTGIPSFITTLGMMMFWRGILLAVTGGFPIILARRVDMLQYLGGRIYGGLRYSALWFVVLALIFSIILEQTQYGNWVFATGGSLGAARALGIATGSVKLINFVLCSVLAGFAGLTTFARFKLVDPTFGQELELEAIASAVMGGTLLTGGYGSVLGACIGAFMISMVRNGLVLAGAPAYWYRAFIGVILIIAAVINARIRRKVAG
ncbi:ABC transporter permease [Pseudothermotoga sp.]|nr:ABC transporter permease [Pseudothermotoga sp.]MCX7813359.1 ABC transporter permease [Pseudothermotoga sp.]MDW8139653.1 ABC transporter permease [Pseudothermotoga sp.]